jgi:hypothetical protein
MDETPTGGQNFCSSHFESLASLFLRLGQDYATIFCAPCAHKQLSVVSEDLLPVSIVSVKISGWFVRDNGAL